MANITIDIETYSDVPISSAGLYRYAESPNFEILLIAWIDDNGKQHQIDLVSGRHDSRVQTLADIMPDDHAVKQAQGQEQGQEQDIQTLRGLLLDSGTVKHAYNAAFEWFCLSRWLGLTPAQRTDWLHQWSCSMLTALYHGYPASLANAGAALGLPTDKQKLTTGRELIRVFCVPARPSRSNGNRARTMPWHEPEKWELFKIYNLQDVVTERAFDDALDTMPVPERESQLWRLDQQINSRGVMIDQDVVQGALQIADSLSRELTAEAQQLTELDNPGSVQQLRGWLQSEAGTATDDLSKATVRSLLNRDELDQDAQRVLEIRQELGKTSVRKYDAMAAACCRDDRVRGMLQFYGAPRTGRWAGRIVQLQNLPRNNLESLDTAREIVKHKDGELLGALYGSVFDTLSQLVRTAFIPSNGGTFLVADYSAIEARVIAWLAGEQWRMDVFAQGGDIYCASASQMFKVPVEKHGVNGHLRQKGKVAELALGYQGGPGALIAMGALDMGLAEDELPDIVAKWREASPHIQGLWWRVEEAAISAIKTGKPTPVSQGVWYSLAADGLGQTYLVATLPSGRALYYAKPYLAPNRWGKDSIHFAGSIQSKRGSGGWGDQETYGGKLTENLIQAIARDCLADAMLRLDAAGYQTVMHIHDEVVIDYPGADAEAALDRAAKIMSESIPWAPGLLLRADGYTTPYYKKD